MSLNINLSAKDINARQSSKIMHKENFSIDDRNSSLGPSRAVDILTGESKIEQAIIESIIPIRLEGSEEITVLGNKGIWANKSEVTNWHGPIEQYKLNEGAPITIIKKNNSAVEYIQDVTVKYLKPPSPPAPGDLIIRSENSNTISFPPAPPQIIRQLSNRPLTPEPLVIREAPPEPPPLIPRKVVRIIDNSANYPPRRVIIERLPNLPPKPQPILVERWLPYAPQKRRVIYEQSNTKSQETPRNLIIQWEAPNVTYKTSINWLGVETNVDPNEYAAKHGNTLIKTENLPQFVKDLDVESGFQQHVNEILNDFELEGDVHALKYLDLDKEGLSKYKKSLNGKHGDYDFPVTTV